jgi:hypothetical protein
MKSTVSIIVDGKRGREITLVECCTCVDYGYDFDYDVIVHEKSLVDDDSDPTTSTYFDDYEIWMATSNESRLAVVAVAIAASSMGLHTRDNKLDQCIRPDDVDNKVDRSLVNVSVSWMRHEHSV